MCFFILISQSCKKEETKLKPIKNSSIEEPFYFEFINQKTKETVNKIYRDSTYLAVIHYKNDKMDILNPETFKDSPERYLYFYLARNDENLSNKKLEFLENNIQFDTFYSISNRKIPVFDLSFKTKGVKFINGIIDDFIYITQKDTTKTRIISEKIAITKEILVE